MHWWYNSKNQQGTSAHAILLEWLSIHRNATNVVLKDNQAQFKYNEQVLSDMVSYLDSNGIKTNKTALYNKIRLMCLDYTLAWAVQDRRQTYELDLAADETVEDRVNLLCRDYYQLEDILDPAAGKKQPSQPATGAGTTPSSKSSDTSKQEASVPAKSKPKAKTTRNMSAMYTLLKQARVFYDEGIFEKEEYDGKRLLIVEKYI
ncbi:hypothetical protein MBANPS3_011507 [Mucor bainieri]